MFPIAAFLLAGGMTENEAQQIFSIALKNSSTRTARRRIDHIGRPTGFADIIAEWGRAKRFLDASGWPRDLPMSGANSFSSLVHAVDPTTDPASALAILRRYGNVRRTKTGKYSLTNSFFNTSGPTAMAYEPVAYFLSDASETLGRILKRSKRPSGPPLFWQKTENRFISETAAKEFFEFAKERSLVFLDELDDWLEAHRARRKANRRSSRRVGLGIFSIYSDPEQ